jgi:hypothetical protein
MDEEIREFEVTLNDETIKKLTVRNANNEELQEGEFEYSRAFNNAIVRGLMPRAKLLSELEKSGVWTREDDEAIEKQRLLVIRLEDALDNADESSRERIASELGEERQKLFTSRQSKTEILSHSAEAKAEESQRNFLVSKVIEYADTGTRVWKNFSDYMKEEDGNLLFRATYEYLTFINGLPSDFANKFPENATEDSEETEEVEDGEDTSTEAEEAATEQPAPPAESAAQ